jgi:hypothetical protein
LQDNGYTATTSSLIANLGSELATQLPPGSTETGSFVFSNAQGSATVYTPASIINALNNLVFPGATLIRDI